MVIRRVLVDAFGTLCSPRRPVHIQYAEIAQQHGLQVDSDRLKAGFKPAFKHWATLHPLYGNFSTPPLTADEWWTGLIEDAFLHAGVAPSAFSPLKPALTTSIIHRFRSSAGYALHTDVPPFLSSLASLASLCSPSPAVVSGSDEGIIQVLQSLDVTSPPSASPHEEGKIRPEEIWTTWRVEREKSDGAFWERVLDRLNTTSHLDEPIRAHQVLVVGDELVPDYLTPRKLGMQALLLRRPPETGGQLARLSHGDELSGEEEGLEVIHSLEEVAPWIEQYNRRC